MSNRLAGLWIKKIGQNRGTPRLWFDCLRIAAAGLLPGASGKAPSISGML